MTDYKAEAKKIEEKIIEMRRAFHRCPELRMDMVETEKLILGYLKEFGITEVRTGIGGKGIAATVRGRSDSPCIAVRADCDGLPIREETGLPFASTNGNMHACGHDAHTAMALGAAKLLQDHRDELEGSVKFIFQPYEEGGGGAEPMIRDGVLSDPRVDAVVGLHTGNLYSGDFKGGDIALHERSMSFNIIGMKIVFTGRGAHVSAPHLSSDPVFAAASFVTQLQQVVSRNRNPASPAVCAVTTIHGGVRNNIIPDEVVMEGSLRSPDRAETDAFFKRVEEIAAGVSLACGVKGRVEKSYFIPGIVIDPGLCREFRTVAEEIVGKEHVVPITEWTPIGEDFSHFSLAKPSLFFFHCSRFSDRENYPHHHPKFDVDEKQLWSGSALFAAFAARWTKDHKQA